MTEFLSRVSALSYAMNNNPVSGHEPAPSLEEAIEALNGLAMGGQTLQEVTNDYQTVLKALKAFANGSQL